MEDTAQTVPALLDQLGELDDGAVDARVGADDEDVGGRHRRQVVQPVGDLRVALEEPVAEHVGRLATEDDHVPQGDPVGRHQPAGATGDLHGEGLGVPGPERLDDATRPQRRHHQVGRLLHRSTGLRADPGHDRRKGVEVGLGADGAPRSAAAVGRTVTGGGNPISHPAGAAAALAGALGAALAGVDPGRVQASVIGVAGGSALRTPPVAARFGQVWTDAGLTCDPGYAPDLEVAFAAGTPEPDGSVLVAGTGATAGAVSGRRLTRTADGHGWLLGDDGSGFWLGREAVRAALRTLDAGEPPGPLVGAVLRELAGVETADELALAGDR